MCTGPRRTPNNEALGQASHCSPLFHCIVPSLHSKWQVSMCQPLSTAFTFFLWVLLPYNFMASTPWLLWPLFILWPFSSNNQCSLQFDIFHLNYWERISHRLYSSLYTRPLATLWTSNPYVRNPFLVQSTWLWVVGDGGPLAFIELSV